MKHLSKRLMSFSRNLKVKKLMWKLYNRWLLEFQYYIYLIFKIRPSMVRFEYWLKWSNLFSTFQLLILNHCDWVDLFYQLFENGFRIIRIRSSNVVNKLANFNEFFNPKPQQLILLNFFLMFHINIFKLFS